MEPKEREQLALFLESLPTRVQNAFAEKAVNAFIELHEICAEHGFVLYEMGSICESVRRVLAGEDSPANVVAFIAEDERIEEDNRGKIPVIAQEIQTKIFDVVLPILKQAGMKVSESLILNPLSLTADNRLQTATQPESSDTPSPRGLGTSPLKRGRGGGGEVSASIGVPSASSASAMDERHLRALARIAAGTNHTEAQLVEQFQTLPEGLRRAITTVDTANAIQEIAKKFLLHIDQMAALASETGLVLLGLTHPRDFVKNLATRLRISETRALEIAKEVSEQILVKVREALRNLHEEIISNTESRMSKNQEQGSQKEEKVKTRLNAQRSTLNMSLNTPYSKEAKWNTGEQSRISNFESRKIPNTENEKEEKLTREEVLRGIENPDKLEVSSFKFQGQPKIQNSQLKTPNLKLETKVGPTGWKAPAAADGGKFQVSSFKFQGSPQTDDKSVLKQPPVLKPSAPPPIPNDKEEGDENDFLERKLAGPTGAAHEEKRYTIDPYREPLDS